MTSALREMVPADKRRKPVAIGPRAGRLPAVEIRSLPTPQDERLPGFFPRRPLDQYLGCANICLMRESGPALRDRIRELARTLMAARPAGTTRALWYLTLASLLDAETKNMMNELGVGEPCRTKRSAATR